MNNNIVMLIGAGGMIPWGAPTTGKLTEIIRKDNSFKSYTGQPVGDWFYNKLAGLYHRDLESINFETILNSIEYLSTFTSSKYRDSVSIYKNIMPAFLEEKECLMELLWFDRIYRKQNDYWHIENNRYKSVGLWNDYDSFFDKLYKHYINIIVNSVEGYSLRYAENKIDKQWNKFIHFIDSITRIYTTNYDRLIPGISDKNFFEGFTLINDELKFDDSKVLKVDDIDCYYNLHGSVHYQLDFPNSVINVLDNAIYNFGNGSSGIDDVDQDKRKLIKSNIVSGYNKSSRILNTPYAQFYHRFYTDAINTNKIIIIGYSFGDIHINNALRTAFQLNDNLSISIIDYMVYNEDVTVKTEYDWVTIDGKGDAFISDDFGVYSIISKKEQRERIKIYRKGFEQFLQCEEWLNVFQSIV